MPVYEYRCDDCQHQFELRQKFSDAPADQCPKCGGVVRKMVSLASFSLKGGGWYGDGYGEKAEATRSETEAASETGVTPETAAPDTAATDMSASQAPSTTQSESEVTSTVAEKPAVTEKPTLAT
jgi:putative FmdB family regulatory protein